MQQQHSKALYPTDRSVVVFPAFRLWRGLAVAGGRRESSIVLSLARGAASNPTFRGKLASEVFDSPVLIALDTRQDYGEDRWIGLGLLYQFYYLIAYLN